MKRGGVEWLAPADAIAVVLTARADGIPLLGLDAALLGESSTQPSLEDGWDYTGARYPLVQDPYSHAIAFIKDRAAKGMHFEIVLGVRKS